MNAADDVQLLKELGNLLERQIELARRGSFGQLERLAGQCEPLVARIKAAGLLERPEYKEACERLSWLYRNLQLMLSAQRDDAAAMLNRIRKGRKMISAYHSNFTG
jgi:hypothetical protein